MPTFGKPAFVPQMNGFAPTKGVPAPYPAPSGYRWSYVTENSVRTAENGSFVVELVRIA